MRGSLPVLDGSGCFAHIRSWPVASDAAAQAIVSLQRNSRSDRRVLEMTCMTRSGHRPIRSAGVLVLPPILAPRMQHPRRRFITTKAAYVLTAWS